MSIQYCSIRNKVDTIKIKTESMKVTEKCPTCIFKYIHQLNDNTEHTEGQPTGDKTG